MSSAMVGSSAAGQQAGRLIVEPRSLLDRNGRERSGLSILIENGRIVAIESAAMFEALEGRRILAPRCVALPGLSNMHHHGRAVSTVAGGLPDSSLENWVVGLMGMPIGSVSSEALRIASTFARNGITTSLHVHSTAAASAAEYEQELRSILSAYATVGVRVVISADLRDQGLPVYADEEAFFSRLTPDTARRVRAALPPCPPIEEALEVIDSLRAEASTGRFGDATVVPGPVAHLWCSDHLLAATARYATSHGTPLQTHLLQTPIDRRLERHRFGHGTLQEFKDLGLLNERLSVAHAVLVDDSEIELLSKSGATVVVAPSSCLRILSAVAPVGRLLTAGVNVALGTDSMGLAAREDLFEEARLLQGLSRFGNPEQAQIPSDELFRMITVNAGRAIARSDIGLLEVGAVGDVVLVDVDQLGPLTTAVSCVDAILGLATAPHHVRTVVISGRVVVEEGKPLVDEPHSPYTEPASEVRQLVSEILPVTRSHYLDWISRSDL